MSIEKLLHGDKKAFVSLFDLASLTMKHNKATVKETAQALNKLLKTLTLYQYGMDNFCEVGKATRYPEYLDDNMNRLVLNDIVERELNQVELFGEFDQQFASSYFDGIYEENVYCPAETMYFKCSDIKEIFNQNEIKIEFDEEPKIPNEYKYIPYFNAHDAAMIMCNVSPSESRKNKDYWKNPPLDVALKLEVIQSNIEELVFMSYPEGMARDVLATTDYHAAFYIQDDWLRWCLKKGFTWHIPFNESQTVNIDGATDEVLKSEYKKLSADNEKLREQITKQQREIDELRRLSNATEATALHFTHLMKVVIETQKDYWGNWQEGGKPIDQEWIKSKLREKYKGFSEVRINAIEIIACPFDRKPTKKNLYPEG